MHPYTWHQMLHQVQKLYTPYKPLTTEIKGKYICFTHFQNVFPVHLYHLFNSPSFNTWGETSCHLLMLFYWIQFPVVRSERIKESDLYPTILWSHPTSVKNWLLSSLKPPLAFQTPAATYRQTRDTQLPAPRLHQPTAHWCGRKNNDTHAHTLTMLIISVCMCGCLCAIRASMTTSFVFNIMNVLLSMDKDRGGKEQLWRGGGGNKMEGFFYWQLDSRATPWSLCPVNPMIKTVIKMSQ